MMLQDVFFCWLITRNVPVVYCSNNAHSGLEFLWAAHVLITQEFQGVKTGKSDAGGKGRHVAG